VHENGIFPVWNVEERGAGAVRSCQPRAERDPAARIALEQQRCRRVAEQDPRPGIVGREAT
jgi:hypothetical protein